ncbi:serine/threonine-protein kinase ATM [Drosophila willistoni]|uniref:serine/threonine-protein kinase ATM n=1 Tax=Drosophila willistoni TaxID=7260 RepID=UPI00017D98BD|nr:serine/threonine-protein kinase ATM [Drosophila willistoni]
MSGLLNEIHRIATDIRSEKAPARNKAIEQFDQKLNSSKEALNALFQDKKTDLTWTSVFESAKEAIFKHAGNLQDAREKTFKSLADKNYLYGNVLGKIINYNLEVGTTTTGHFLAKTTVFNAFEEFIKTRIVVKHFGERILNILDRGIYLSPSYVRELRVNEYSRILSYLFELNIENDEFLRSKLLKCITKTLQLAKDRVQLHNDLVEYLPGLAYFAQTAINSERKVEIVRLYSIFVSELSVNYHHRLCLHIQEILPKLCEFHNDDVFRDDTRNIFFKSVIHSLNSMYPKLNLCDFTTFQVPINENWAQTMCKLKSIVYMEIKANSLQRYKTAQLNNDKFSESFIKMSAMIMFIVLWHIEVKGAAPDAAGDVPKKIHRQNDQMETMFKLIDKKEATFSDIWFAIFAELLQLSDGILNLANYQQALTITLDVLQMYGNARNLKNIRLCIVSLLKKERNWLDTQSLPPNTFGELWTQITTNLISDTTANGDEIREKQIILQMLIRHGKLDPKVVRNLLQTITSNEVLKRNECIATIREIFIRSRLCGLDKASSVEFKPIVEWAYASGERSTATQAIHNIAAIDAKLLADTFSISIINFLDEQQLQQLCNQNADAIGNDSESDHKMLSYKYNRKLVCLDRDFLGHFKAKNNLTTETNGAAKNCLYQNNYEFLMRTLNFQNANDNQPRSMLKNLNSLHKLVCTMERLLNYKVFDDANFTTCPLIKRIGLFLSHIEFQYKANSPVAISDADLRDILRLQIAVLDVFQSNHVLLNYLENQPIEMLIEFVGVTLKQNSIKRERAENHDFDTITGLCLQILSGLCASNSHRDEAFDHLAKVTMRWQPKDILIVTKMFCSCNSLSDASCIWLVDKLKPVFQHHYQDLDIISEVVDYLPKIFYFVYNMEHQLDDMFMALNSLLKIALKKSYTSQLTAKILYCVGQIAQRCRNIYAMENFGVICKSAAKFITMPTLDVRYATLCTLTILLNTECVAGDAINDAQDHWTFCDELYTSIDFKKFSFDDEDMMQNSHSAMFQILLAIFAFSSFHQETALKQLLHFCALRKLNETDFCALNSLVPCHNRTMRDLLRTYANMMLHKWCSKGWPVSKFPFFLCYDTKTDFRKANGKSIMAYTILYAKPDDIQRYRKIIKEEEALPLIAAYVMPECSKCEEFQTPAYQQHYRNLVNNLNELNAKDIECNALTIYNLISLLFDAEEMVKLFGDSVPWINSREWYNLTTDSLFKSLNWHINQECNSLNNNIEDLGVKVMATLQTKHSIVLIDLFGILKTNCYTAVFTSQTLHSLFHYCVIANAVYDSARMLEHQTTKDNSHHMQSSYFVRDIWYFLVRFLKHRHAYMHSDLSTNAAQCQIATLDFLKMLLEKPKFQTERFSSHMNEIAKLLVNFIVQSKQKPVKDKAVVILEHVLEAYKTQINTQPLLEESTECEFLKSLREQFNESLPKTDKGNVTEYIQSFLTNTSVERLNDLREYISEHKDKLQSNESLLFDLINRLLRLARDCHNKNTSLDALKCLAEIGPMHLRHVSYYFQTEFDTLQESDKLPMEQFLTIICESFEKYLFEFDPKTQEALITVARNVVNSKAGIKIKSFYSNLQIFVGKSKDVNFLNKPISTIDWLAALEATKHLSYESWICAFMSRVFKECGWQGFDNLAAESYSFAEICLQPFVKLLLDNKEQHLDSLCQMLDHFFQSFVSQQSNHVIFQEKRAIKKLLNICECIRTTNNWCIPIELSNVVLASNHCQAYFLSVLYLELWACSNSEKSTAEILANETFQACAKKSYESIGCLDAIPGFLNPLSSRVDFLNHDNNLCGILLESDNSHRQLCVDIMKSNGMWSWAHLRQHQNQGTERDYEIFWRLGQWNELVDHQNSLGDIGRASVNLEQEFKKYHYLALKSINNREEENSRSAIGSAYQCVVDILQDISMECLQIVYKYMTWLCTLTQAEDFCQIQFATQLSTSNLGQLFNKWQTELDLKYGNFACKEYIISHQIALFKMAGTRASRRMQGFYKENPIDMYLLKGIAECKSSGKLNLASKYIAMLRDLTGINKSSKISMLLEDADVNIRTGNHRIAKAILNHMETNKEFNYCLQRVPALRMQGEFLLDSNAESLSSVLHSKFNGSLKLLNDFVEHKDTLQEKFPQIFKWQEFAAFENENRKAAYASIAKYADREYQQLHDYRQSQDYNTLAEIIAQNRQVADKVTTREDRDHRIIAVHMKRFANLDEKELQRIDDNLTEHLCTAVQNYMAYCKLDSGLSSAAIYRIISLWFTNARNMVLLTKLESEIQTVPSYKFICAVNQLIGRLNSKNRELLKILVDLLVRCGQEHPHHTFYQLYPLVFAKLDGVNSNTEREAIAGKIIAKIRENNPSVLETSKQLETMFPVLIAYANHDSESENNKPTAKSIAERNKLRDYILRLKKLNAVHCPTLELPVSPSKEYNITSIVKWTNEFSDCGGLNAPTKVICLCSDGQLRSQLIKGKDDLRQDAVMQQVFGIVNELLQQDSEFIERNLHVRTYKVTPLSMRSGILEWCSNSIPVGRYLVGEGKSGAHMKYRPNDWNNNKCRTLSHTHLRAPKDKRFEIYKQICEHVKPVFHYFLLEKFPIPGIWFERRLAYTNSVATTSIVGYILGLGDRHTQNILIDEQTAEVIHIDFGIAFEQGKIQATPETVPFRLTRDFVAPMGVCGTNGVFTKSCEATMQILRRYKSVLITILEVLLYDPLFIWGVLSKKKTNQPTGEESVNLVAQRALLLVQNKLEGRESGTLGNSNVEAQVERLINEATLPSNLCMLFPGWDPYL